MLKEFGQDLKRLRESKNITIAEVSAQTRINPKYIEKLESGIFDFQPDTYIRAFLRSYARSINESEDHILSDYGKAKSGFYARKTSKKEDVPLSIKPVTEPEKVIQGEEIKKSSSVKPAEEKTVSKKEESVRSSKPEKKYDDDEEYSNKTWTQKVLLGLLILIILAGAYYLYTYLNQADNNQSNVKQKPFNEIAEDYESKMNGNPKDTTPVQDTTNVSSTIPNDSLKLTIVTSKDVRIKVYIDEKRIVEEEIPAKDSLSMFAKDQFRFSSSANNSVDIYLNGKYLKKPSHLTTATIKNLIINKSGIVSE